MKIKILLYIRSVVLCQDVLVEKHPCKSQQGFWMLSKMRFSSIEQSKSEIILWLNSSHDIMILPGFQSQFCH